MGLDSYLKKMPRYKDTTAHEVSVIESYLGWIKEKESGSKYANCTFKERCGIELSELPDSEVIEFYRPFYKPTYFDWDKNKEYPWYRIFEEVGYWRKANQIHNWFVENIQDGIDDCQYHREVAKEDLEELLYTCYEVLCNPDLAELKFPTQCGFLFGSTDYDEWYIKNVKSTVDIITKILETTDFNKQMIVYISSW